MCGETNPIITAFSEEQEVKQEPFSDTWKFERKIGENLYLFYRFRNGKAFHAPMYIHTFRVISNRHLTKAQLYLYENPNPECLTSVSDKLKWYRIYHGFLQRDVANAMGVDRTTYSHYEENMLDAYPLDKLELVATLFQIDVIDLLDEYNLFLYHGQGQKIKELRKSLQLTQSEFARYIHVPLGTLKKWEQNKVRMQKTAFEKLFCLQNMKSEV